MKIWIDGYEANSPDRLGSSQVGFELLKSFAKIDKKNDFTILLPSEPVADLPKARAGWKYQVVSPKRLWTRLSLPKFINQSKDKPDVIFSPTHYIPHAGKVRRVSMIFDLSFLKFKSMFKKRDLWQLTIGTKYGAKNSSQIITISESSKKDIVDSYRVGNSKVIVSYPGYDKELFYPRNDRKQVVKILDKYKITSDYVIYIGTIQPRKNLERLIEAFKEIENLKLVIVGKTTGQGRQGWMFEQILNKPKELGISNKVIFTGFAPTEDIPYLLTGAKAYVLPSLWEGFGIPVVEAMACGTPVIVSRVSSLPEVVEDAGLQIDPYSILDIKNAILKIVKDRELAQALSKKGLVRARQFSWDKMAEKVLEVLEKS